MGPTISSANHRPLACPTYGSRFCGADGAAPRELNAYSGVKAVLGRPGKRTSVVCRI